MKSYKYIPFSILLICIFTIMISCSRMDDYNDFLDGKELVYPGKVDSVKIHSGKNRIAISWLLTSDPKITKAVVYWNNMADSVVVPITRTEGVDSIGVIIPNLQIGVYNFIIYTYDKDNNKSVPVTISGRVFGDDYEKTLINRPIKSAYRWNNEAPLFVLWDKLDPTSSNVAVGAKITYKDGDGNNHSERVSFKTSNDTSILVLPGNISPTQIIEFSTMIKPDSVALDTFYAPKEKLIYSFTRPIVAKEDASGIIDVRPINSTIDKVGLKFTKTINLSRLSFDTMTGYSVDVQLLNTGIPAGTVAMDLNDVTMTNTSGGGVSAIEVPGGKSKIQLNFTIHKSVIDANPNKKLAFTINFSNLVASKFKANGLVYSVAFVVNTEDFKTIPVLDVTATYFKNPGGAAPFFIRGDASADRWVTAKDWIANPAALNVGGKGGIDSPGNGNNYLNFFRWDFTSAILDGKLYQTFKLPAGKYEFKVDLNDASINPNPGNAVYYVVAEGSTLPNTSNLASSIAYASYTASKVNFVLSSEKTVSIGLLAYLNDQYQEYRAKGVKLIQYDVGVFY